MLNNYKPEKIFLFTALMIGIMLIIITPPMCTPDENAHFMNAYSISSADLFPEVNENGALGRYVPQYVLDFLNKYNGAFNGNFDQKYSLKSMYYDSWLINQNTEHAFYQSGLTKVNPFSYFFSSIGMFIGKLLSKFTFKEIAQPYNLLLLGRFANLLFYVSIIYTSIKKTPYFKKTMLLIALMPMSLYLGSSVNYDAILIPLSILLFSTIIKIYYSSEDEKLTRTDILCVLLCVFFMVSVKQICAPLLIVLLALPIKKFGDKTKYLKCIFASFITGCIAYFPNVILLLKFKNYETASSSYVMEQKEFLLANINRIPDIIQNTISQTTGFWLNSFFGNLGSLDINFPVIIVVIFLLVLLITSLIDASVIEHANYKLRVLPVIAVLVSVLGMFYVMYTTWTCYPEIAGVGVDYVTGIQGRYFIPFFLFTLLPITNNVLHRKRYTLSIEKSTESINYILVICCDLIMLFLVYSRYWD